MLSWLLGWNLRLADWCRNNNRHLALFSFHHGRYFAINHLLVLPRWVQDFCRRRSFQNGRQKLNVHLIRLWAFGMHKDFRYAPLVSLLSFRSLIWLILPCSLSSICRQNLKLHGSKNRQLIRLIVVVGLRSNYLNV